MSNTLDHKCPSCNAVLKFNPHGQNWKCEYCRSEFNIQQLEEYEKKTGKVLEEESTNNDIDLYLCKNCGAEIIADPNVSTTSCVYCKNTAILKNKLQGEFNPDYVIPFRKTKEDAIAAFKKLSKGRILMPKEFNNKKNISEMSGIYIPFWIYDYNSNGEMEANCKRITSWRSGNYRYTKTDTYLVTRGGSMSFEKVPVDGSKRFRNDIMNSIEPFDYKDLKEFNYSYLSGFLSEKYDVTKDEAIKEGIERAKNSFVEQMRKDIIGYNVVVPTKSSINLENTKSSYVLLPVWMLNIKYKEKIYTFAMNGQTGELIGDIPIDKKKAVLLWIVIFIISIIILFVISYFSR
mgnify:CR=1 FL=1